MKAALRVSPEPFEFRSQHFCDAAERLVQLTGRSLLLCRQELFLAEGDFAEAQSALCAADSAPSSTLLLH